ncbi:MAG: acyltransferase [Clostridia bacterium]|nr:acyltransferase [Clostridia bacterium]
MSSAVAAIKNKNRNYTLDLLKFCLSLMVVAIHSNLFSRTLYPWLRLAVPIFFIISSYLFFGKIKNIENQKEKSKCLARYVKRNLILYLFWFVVLFPYTLMIRKYFSAGIMKGLYLMMRGFLLSDTFPASWYIQASIVAVSVVFFLSKKMNDSMLFAISATFYILTCFRSSYWDTFSQIPVISSVLSTYTKIFMVPMHNFPAAFFWIVIGKIFAEHKIDYGKVINGICLVISAVMLYCEWLFVKNINGTYKNECYIMLMPVVFFIFSLVYDIKIKGSDIYVKMGTISIIIYTSHSIVRSIVKLFFERILGIESIPLVFITVVIICIVEGFIILSLENHKFFRWLKFSH